MNIGKLRQRITIEQPGRGTANTFGEKPQTWTAFKTVWAQVAPVSGQEQDFARSFAATVTHKVVIRFLAGITPTMRINFGGRFFSIDGIVNDEECNVQITLFCTEKVGT